jgi:hypothetical protein
MGSLWEPTQFLLNNWGLAKIEKIFKNSKIEYKCSLSIFDKMLRIY